MNDVNYNGWIGAGLFFSVAILIIFGTYGYIEPGWRAATQARFTAERVERGAELYAENCTRCHGEHGEGTRRLGPTLNTAEFLAEANNQAIFDTITDGRPNTSMPAWGQTNGGPFTAEEVQDLTAFIRAWEPTAPPALEIKVKADAALGAALFSTTCFGCHGLNGEGTGFAPALNDLEKLKTFDDTWYRQTIADGRPAQGMPTWGKVLSPAQINDLVAFIRRWESPPPSVSGDSEEAGDLLAKGKQIYDYTAGDVGCAYCHGLDGKGHGPSGENAPNIRGMTATDAKQALKNIIYMDFIELSKDEIEAVGAYLQYLAEQP